MEESEEFQEAEILWPDSDSIHGMTGPLQVRRQGRDKKPQQSVEAAARADQVSYTRTPGSVYGNVANERKVIPPHVVVASREAGEKTAFSMCTGKGRTLRGRDLMQVRDAVMRMTGFVER